METNNYAAARHLALILDEVGQNGRTTRLWLEAASRVGPSGYDAEIIRWLVDYVAIENDTTNRQFLGAIWDTEAYSQMRDSADLPERYLFGTFLIEYTGGSFAEMGNALRAIAEQL
jgi:hypothetical protein